MSAEGTVVFRLRGGSCRLALIALLGMGLGLAPVCAQDSSAKPQAPEAQPVPEAGGPQGDLGPYSIPSKKKEEPPPEPVHPPKNPPAVGNFSVTKDVALVTVPVMVTANSSGQFIPNLKEGNFRVMEDGVPQKINTFNVTQAPITAVLLVEFADIPRPFLYDTLTAAYSFTHLLKPQDWVAVMYYDLRPHILTDFTQDKRQVEGALNELRVPGFRDTNLYDALSDAIDRLERIEGRKYVVLISTGRDTFSRLTYDQMLKRIKGTKDITIFAMSTGRAYREWMEARSSRFETSTLDMDFLQADNEMNTFAKLTGGRAYFPRFQGEFPDDFQDMASSIRNQYVLTYRPTNPALDGTYRKLKVEVVDPETGAPLKLVDQKGKNLKYTIVAREGYTAKHQVE
jgi:VWFA-related protein